MTREMQAAVVCLALLAVPIAAELGAQQPPAARPTHSVLAPGVAASQPMVIPLRTVAGRVLLRNFVVGRGTAKDVPNADFSVMELSAGHVFTTIAGDRQERVPGDFWTVDKGSTITFDNPEPQSAAVIRVTAFEEGR